MSKAESNKKWAKEHAADIRSYNRDYYAKKSAELREKRKQKYRDDPAYREKAIERARNRRKAAKAGSAPQQSN